ncbi:50S ribosomal protein L13 [Candidatus Kuenenbacteria bacterium]|nr:50S ribosomal protein L13 [Candidatus Kuenenbacteria bacterium]
MKKEIKRQEHVIDASGKVLGRLASQIAVLLRGKHKPEFERHIDLGDKVVVENVDKIKVTGNKFNDKIYYKGSTRPGGLKKTKMKAVVADKGWAEVLRRAVYHMLPGNKLRPEIMKRLIIK